MNIEIRNIKEEDYIKLQELAVKCPPLDVHTPYTYWVISRYFSDLSFIAFDNEQAIGYITCVNGKTGILIWQIGILQEYRGKGLSERLIAKVFEEVGKNCSETSVNVSIASDNVESNAAFTGFCRKKGYVMQKIGDVDLTDIRDEGVKEYEILYSIYPK